MVTLANLVTAAAAAVLLSGHHHHVLAARLTKVNYLNNATSKAEMYIYVPDRVVSSPPLVVTPTNSAQSYFQNAKITWGTCWDVSVEPGTRSLTHGDGGGGGDDTQAIAKHGSARLPLTGGSSGAMMMGNVMAATYPALFGGGDCSGGQSRASAEQWGSVARNMYPGHDGPRPKMQIWHGSVDSTLAPANYQETIKLWINVFGVDQTPTRSQKNYPQANYQTDDYGEKVQGIHAAGVGHSVPANLTASELWFGL
ncbi:Alpha/Beta hydrolase protein [Chaetomidium leptoderma]|uniref:Alpha/Beta hydrolase protein n=1 Tax=Chaetomidium leptoderma TaxID=669021 RepID=A0AAN6VQ42_9PEZI|nr:Alpha/Beta hydrolase protein [Chaetomidium leptoderma]